MLPLCSELGKMAVVRYHTQEHLWLFEPEGPPDCWCHNISVPSRYYCYIFLRLKGLWDHAIIFLEHMYLLDTVGRLGREETQ